MSYYKQYLSKSIIFLANNIHHPTISINNFINTINSKNMSSTNISSQQSNLSQPQSNPNSQQSNPLSNISNLSLPQTKCINNNQGVLICLNQICTHNHIIICYNKTCKCRENHFKCKKADIQFIWSVVDSKIYPTQQLNNYIDKTIDTAIQKLQSLRTKLEQKINHRMKYVRLGQLQKKFIKFINKDPKTTSFLSQESSKLWDIVNLNYQLNKYSIIQPLIQNLDKFSADIHTKSISVQKCITRTMQNFLKFHKNIYIPQLERKLDSIQLKVSQQITKVSSICTTNKMSQQLLKFFNNQIKGVEFLFCASKDDFSIEKFYQKCGKVESTLIVCKTQHDKIIGAYSSKEHYFPGCTVSWYGSEGEFFIFSLSEKEKFMNKSHVGGIRTGPHSRQIKFGNKQFYIRDKSNVNGNCQSCPGQSNYYNPGFINASIGNYKRFNGGNKKKFSIKQWQVYKIIF